MKTTAYPSDTNTANPHTLQTPIQQTPYHLDSKKSITIAVLILEGIVMEYLFMINHYPRRSVKIASYPPSFRFVAEAASIECSEGMVLVIPWIANCSYGLPPRRILESLQIDIGFRPAEFQYIMRTTARENSLQIH